MSSVLLEVDGARYDWPLPDGRSCLTVAGLKQSIKERTEKTRQKVLYHDRLRFSPGARGGQPLEDEAELPLGRAVVRVGGPGSVVNMLALWCKSHLSALDDVREEPGPQQPPAAPKPRKVAGLAPQATPLQAWKPNAKASQRTSGAAPTVVRQPVAHLGPAAHTARLLESLRRQQAGPQAPERRQEPRSTSRRVSADEGLPGLGAAWPPGLGAAHEPLHAGWTDAASAQGAGAQLVDWENAAMLQAAAELSERHLQADEEAQLKWALEESTRLAQLQEAQQHAGEPPPSAAPGASLPTVGGAGATEAEGEEEEDLYGRGDSSDADGPEESSDEEPPPLELIPNSEE